MTKKDLNEMEDMILTENIEGDNDGNKGPTIVMQGVSGKRITADVKVVKVKKKSTRAVDELKDTEQSEQVSFEPNLNNSDAQTIDQLNVDAKSHQDVNNGATGNSRLKASETLQSNQGPTLAQAETGRTSGLSELPNPVENADLEAKVVPTVSTKNEPAKVQTATVAGGAAVSSRADAITKSATNVTAAQSLPADDTGNKKAEAKKDRPKTEANKSEVKGETKDQAPKAERRAAEQKANDNKDKETKDSKHDNGRETKGDAGREHQRTDNQTGKNRQSQANKSKQANRVANPVPNTAIVGNSESSVGALVDPAKSSLAATAARFAAQAAARKKAAAQRAKASTERNHNKDNKDGRDHRGDSRDGNRNNGQRRDNNRNNYGGNDRNFMAKDKDEEPKLQSHSRRAPKRPTMETTILTNLREATTKGGFGNRDNQSRRHDRYRDEAVKNSRNNRRRQIDQFDDTGFNRRRGRRKETPKQPAVVAVLTNVSLPEIITVKEFAEAIKKTAADVIKELMKMGVMATLNQEIDYDTASLIAGEFNIQTDKIVEVTEEDILFDDSEDDEINLQKRPPVVCVMGHVDHGKTSLLDRIRQASVADGEAGGITQHIGAYMVSVGEKEDNQITFLDTPGHEAFTTMRARGAQATDIAILVVAADDGVMPQTIEAINHAKAANTQLVVAINKIDRPGANLDRVKEELSKHDVLPEEWGGSTVMVPVSAKTGEGIDELLEMVLLTAEILDLKANPERQAKGIVIEAKLDKQRGPVATLLVKRGTLHAGDTVVMGEIVGRVRAMYDAKGQVIDSAGPSVPVEIIGLPSVPEAGETFYQVEDEKVARSLAEKRRIKNREASISGSSRMSLDNLYKQMAAGEVKDLNLIVKADVQGSAEAVTQAMLQLSSDEVKVNVIHSAVGAITESDIRLAEVSNAIVIGFNVRPAANVMDMAKETGVDIRMYRVIYHAIEAIESAMKGMLAPKMEEHELGSVEIRQVFKASNIGTIGGAYVISGKIQRNCQIRLVRNGVIIYDGKLASLKRFKDDVREVAQGYECGVAIENYNDIKEGDIIEAFEIREIERD